MVKKVPEGSEILHKDDIEDREMWARIAAEKKEEKKEEKE